MFILCAVTVNLVSFRDNQKAVCIDGSTVILTNDYKAHNCFFSTQNIDLASNRVHCFFRCRNVEGVITRLICALKKGKKRKEKQHRRQSAPLHVMTDVTPIL